MPLVIEKTKYQGQFGVKVAPGSEILILSPGVDCWGISEKQYFNGHSLSESYRGGGGTHMLRHTGMCHPNGLLFHQKSLDMGPHFGQKIPVRRVAFHKICKKIVKSAIF